MVKFNTTAPSPPLFVTVALEPAAPVVTVPIVTSEIASRLAAALFFDARALAAEAAASVADVSASFAFSSAASTLLWIAVA